MSLSTILALVDPQYGAATLQTAKQASAALGAPVDAIVVKLDPRDAIPMIGEGLTGEVVQQIMDSTEAAGNEQAAKARALFNAGKPRRDASFREIVGQKAEVVAREGRLHGMSVLPCASFDGSEIDTIAAALFESGRPALIAPEHAADTFGKRIAIFWKDSPEAAKAVWSAMPFLLQADVVKVFTIGDDADAAASLQAFATAMSRADLDVETVLIAPDDEIESGQLLDAAAGMDADLIVMGAFSHSRLREFVFGGVTQDTLGAMARPIFMAH